MEFRLTLFSLKNKLSRTLDKNVPKIKNEGCFTKSGNISFKMQMCTILSSAKSLYIS